MDRAPLSLQITIVEETFEIGLFWRVTCRLQVILSECGKSEASRLLMSEPSLVTQMVGPAEALVPKVTPDPKMHRPFIFTIGRMLD